MFASHGIRKASKMVFLVSMMLIAVFSVSSFAQTDLTGTWSCDDGGMYYLRQLDDNLWWYGEVSLAPGLWTNVAYGTISGDQIALFWSDVPKGYLKNNGILLLKIESSDLLKAQTKTGSFGGSIWTRQTSAQPSSGTTGQQPQGPAGQGQPPSGPSSEQIGLTSSTGPTTETDSRPPVWPEGRPGTPTQTSGPSNPPTGSETIPSERQNPDFQWLGIDADMVGRYTEAKPDGCPDAHFNLTLHLPENVEVKSIDIRVNKCVDYKEDEDGGLEWSSSYGGDVANLAVFHQSQLLNPVPASTLGNYSGDVRFDLYARVNGGDSYCLSEEETKEGNAWSWMFRMGRRMTAIVHLGDGTDIKQSLLVSGQYAPRITDFRFIGQDADKVAGMDWEKNSPNGIMDGHFVLGLQLYKAPSPVHLKLSLIDVPDREYGNGGAFSTSAYASDWGILGVVHNGVQLNSRHLASYDLLGNFTGDETFDLYVDPGQYYDSPSDEGYAFQPGAKAIIEVDICDGTKLKKTVAI